MVSNFVMSTLSYVFSSYMVCRHFANAAYCLNAALTSDLRARRYRLINCQLNNLVIAQRAPVLISETVLSLAEMRLLQRYLFKWLCHQTALVRGPTVSLESVLMGLLLETVVVCSDWQVVRMILTCSRKATSVTWRAAKLCACMMPSTFRPMEQRTPK